ncbi:MAG: ABC transporter permease subunit [Actinomycetota bacterium]|nr:ABC transporter permease subunit [Actinomycetota bacterium]
MSDAVTADATELGEPPPGVRGSAAWFGWLRGARGALPVIVVVAGLVALWEGYKVLGGLLDDRIGPWDLPVATDDTTMPHSWAVIGSLGEEVQSGRTTEPLWRVLFDAALFTAREAGVGLVAGAAAGITIAVVFSLLPVLGRAFLPWVVVTQTIPFIATAPMVVIWGGRIGWDAWVSVSLISFYLAFFPIVIAMDRGLASADPSKLELMRSYGAGRLSVLFRLRFPSAVPFLFSGLRLSAAAAVIGAIVGELPSGQRDGVGRLLLTFTSFFDLDPERLYAAVAASAMLGLAFVGAVAAAEKVVGRSMGTVSP